MITIGTIVHISKSFKTSARMSSKGRLVQRSFSGELKLEDLGYGSIRI